MAQAKKIERRAFDVYSDVEDATVKLNFLPSIIQNFIDAYKIDHLELTEGERYDLAHADRALYSLLRLVQCELYEVNDAINAIKVWEENKKGSDQETTETTK